MTLTATPAAICESSKGSDANACGASPVTSTIISAALSRTQQVDVTITLAQSASDYTLSATTITIAAGATTGSTTVTATAVNNQDCGTGVCGVAAAADNVLTVTGTSNRTAVSVTGASLTIKDDDILAQVTGVKAEQITGGVDADAGDARISWTKATGATGYVVQWKSGAQTYDSTRSVTVGDVAAAQIDRANFTLGTTYTFRVYAIKTGYDDGTPSTDVTLAHKGWMIFNKTSLAVAEPETTGTATGTYTVKLGSQPTANVTLTLSRDTGSSTTTPLNPTFSPSTLTFTSGNWSTAQTVTVTVTTDTDGVDDVVIIKHAAASTDGDYSGVSATVTATETDDNDAPTSADFTHYVQPKHKSSSTSLRVSLYFPFADTDTPPDGLEAVIIESLPDSTQGTLKFYQRKVGPRKNVTTPVNVGNLALSYPGTPGSRSKILRFYPETGFTSATFTFRVKDKSGNLSEQTYTATLSLQGNVPAKPDLKAYSDNESVRLEWVNPNDNSITKWQYTHQEINGTWGKWRTVTIALTSTPSSLTFTTQNYSTAQDVAVKLAAEPSTTVKVTFTDDNVDTDDDVEFTPSTLTFTTQNWNTTQNVSVKLTSAPASDVTVDFSVGAWANATAHAVTGLTNGTHYNVKLRALNDGGWSPEALKAGVLAQAPPAPKVTAEGGTSDVTLTWTNPNNPSITKYQVRQRERDVLSAFAGNAKAVLFWNDPKDSSITGYGVPVQVHRRLRQLDGHPEQRRVHHHPRRRQPDQQHAAHLPGAARQRLE